MISYIDGIRKALRYRARLLFWEKQIWDFLKAEGFNDFGVAGLMGNLLAESGLRPNNMEDQYQTKLGYNDESYTRAVDNGTYTNFVKDAVGYGLAQWTYWTRK
jgi:tryptophanase